MASHRKPSVQTYDPRTVKEHIVETPLNEEMSKSFLEYAYSVIYADHRFARTVCGVMP